MVSHIEWKFYAYEEIWQKWYKCAWEYSPTQLITLPCNGGVLLGAEHKDSAQRVSFFLFSEDAEVIGERLINAAKEAQNAAS